LRGIVSIGLDGRAGAERGAEYAGRYAAQVQAAASRLRGSNPAPGSIKGAVHEQ